MINADGEDVVVITVEAIDSAGRAIPTASDLVNFKVGGEGVLIGVGNGDPNCHESDKQPKRSLFSGLAQAIVQSTRKAGLIEIEATSIVHWPTVTSTKLAIETKKVELRATVG
jgi:beta-galactosidase